MNKLLSQIHLKNIAIILMIAIFFSADRYLKSLALNGVNFKLIGNFFNFNFTPNYQMAFSLPFGGQWLNLLIILIIIALIIYIFYLILNKSGQRTNIILLTFILFGAISNILDRILFGYVVDYFELRYFTVFNLADALISLGTIAILFNVLKKTNREKSRQKDFGRGEGKPELD